MSVTPARYNFEIWEGATWRQVITVLSAGIGSTPRDLTGYSALMTIQTAPGTTPVYTLSTTNGKISLGGTGGSVSLFIPASDTTGFTVWGAGLYELLITAAGPGDTDAIMWGTVRVKGLS